MDQSRSSNIRVEVPNFKLSDLDKTVVYYLLEVSKRGNEKCTLEKRYSEFDSLNVELKKLFASLPKLPTKTLFKLKNTEDFEKRRQQLDEYLKGLVVRTDIMNSEPMKKFLQLENFAPEITVNPPKLVAEVSNFSQGIRDFVFNQEKGSYQGILFALISDMNVASRVDAYLTNIKFPWEKDLPDVIVSVGILECYVLKNREEWKFERVWVKTFNVQAITLFWDQKSNYLIVGLDDGKVLALNVPSELNYIKYDEVINLKLHESRVMGLYYDTSFSLIHSISEDKYFRSYNLSKRDEITKLLLGNSGLTFLKVDEEFKRAFVSNRSGSVFILDIFRCPAVILHTITTETKGVIRSIDFDQVKNYLIISEFSTGKVYIYDTDKPGKEKFSKQIAEYQDKPNVRQTIWSRNRGEIFLGNEDGTIAFLSAKKGFSIYALKAHDRHITKMFWNEKEKLLFTASKESVMKIWKLPDEWRDKGLEEEEEKEDAIIRKTEVILNTQKQIQRANDDSDDDDLSNWHK